MWHCVFLLIFHVVQAVIVRLNQPSGPLAIKTWLCGLHPDLLPDVVVSCSANHTTDLAAGAPLLF